MSTKVVEIKTLKVGKYIVLGGEASKITSLTTSSPGKHGAAKARLEAVGIFDNQKRSIVKPVDTKVDISSIIYPREQCSINGYGKLRNFRFTNA